jgi:hypothetical protein
MKDRLGEDVGASPDLGNGGADFDRSGPAQLLEQLDVVPPADADRRCRPLAHAVHRHDRRLLERRREERAGGVRLVVLGVEHVPLVALQGVPDLLVHEQLLLDP